MFNRMAKLASPYLAAEVVNLQGTIGTPIAREALGVSQTTNATLGIFGVTSGTITKGDVEWAGYPEGQQASYTKLHDWVAPGDFEGVYYVRATLVAGANPDIGIMNSWLTLHNGTSYGNAFWTWQKAPPFGSRTGTVKLEISTESDGSNIIATGYYKMTATVEQ